MSINNFLKALYAEDIIYHYTKASTAIDHILFNNQLKFSHAKKSNDPIESAKANLRGIYYDSEANSSLSAQQYEDQNELIDSVIKLKDQFTQICFCQNQMEEDSLDINKISNWLGHEELFGFCKPRMWDQYADKFSGVCIAFSKHKILSRNSKKMEIIDGKVKYLKFQELSTSKLTSINGNYLAEVGKEIYKSKITQMIKQAFFYKHIDYIGETEYRIGCFISKDKCVPEVTQGEISFGNTMMLDISGCVEAIFVSSFANEKQKKNCLTMLRD